MQSMTELGSNLTQATFLEFFDEYQAACNAVTSALGERRDVIKRAEGAGINRRGFLNARSLAEQSGEKRQQEFIATHTYMGYLGKPLTMDPIPAPIDNTITEHQRRKVEGDGFQAGRHDQNRQSGNTWAPGSLLYQVYDDAWVAGQEALEAAKAKAAPPPEEPRRPGRPRGSRNRPKNGNGSLLE